MSTPGAFFPATRVTGVDGCRDGWVGVDLDGGGSVTVRAAASLDERLAGTAAQQVVGIDMPLGLLASGWRAADREARALLGPRRSPSTRGKYPGRARQAGRTVKSAKSKPGATTQLTRTSRSPAGRADCQPPARTTC